MEPSDQLSAPLQKHIHGPGARVFLLDLVGDEGEERVAVDRDHLIHEIFDL